MHAPSVLLAAVLFALPIAAQNSSATGSSVLNGWYSCSDYTFSDEGSSPSDAECAIFNAPLCHPGICEDSDSQTVEIFFKRILAANDSDSKPNVWFLQGGPGASSTAMESAMTDLMSLMDGEVNVYTMDHRGTGRSTKLDCIASQVTMSGSPSGSSIDLNEVGACAQDLETKYGDLASFSVTSAASDLSTFISTFLTDKEVFVYGVSYGTALVERLIHLETPEVVGYILDGVATSSGVKNLTQFEYFSTWDSDFGEVADGFLAQCSDDTSCAEKFPTVSLHDTLANLMSSFDNSPNSTCAALVGEFSNYGDPPSYTIRTTFGSLFTDMNTRTLIPVLTYRLNRCNDDDVEVLRYYFNTSSSSLSYSSQDDTFSSTLLYNLIVYSEMWETPEPSWQTLIDRFEGALITDGMTQYSLSSYCAFSQEDSPACNEAAVPSYNASPILYAKDKYWNVAAEIPSQASVLLFSSKLDPQTPHKYAEYLLDSLNGTEKELVTFKIATHGTLWTTPTSDESAPTCAMQILISYVQNGGDLSQIDKSCVDTMPALSFTPSERYASWLLGTTDAYDGALDSSLTNGGNTTSGDDDNETSYKAVFIVFVVLFSVMLIVCAFFAYRWHKLKSAGPAPTVELVTPTETLANSYETVGQKA